MAGTLFGLALSQWHDANGKPEIAAPLYIYDANTGDPVVAFQDYGLTEGLEHPWPIPTDSVGMVPPFWLADGAYRARLTNSAGSVVYFDIPFIQAIGASTGEGGGGGGSVDAEAIFQTGDMKWRPTAGTLAGWVRANGRTIGSATSGATERANADTQPLYEYLWNNFANTVCPVTGGRGASATADFAANKAIGVYSMRGLGQRGLDDMGNTAAGVLTDGTPTVAASTGGTEKPSIPIAQANLPNVNLSSANLGITGSITINNGTSVLRVTNGSRDIATGSTFNWLDSNITASHNLDVNGNVPLGGSGTALTPNTMDPYRLGSFYIKL